ncbi:hypothetical protein HK102_006811, partial [Quaeritorhiza haematococci]
MSSATTISAPAPAPGPVPFRLLPYRRLNTTPADSSTPQQTQEQQQQLRIHWERQLRALLQSPFELFWSTLAHPCDRRCSAIGFLDAYLRDRVKLLSNSGGLGPSRVQNGTGKRGGERQDEVSEGERELDQGLSRLVFRVLCRIGLAPLEIQRLRGGRRGSPGGKGGPGGKASGGKADGVFSSASEWARQAYDLGILSLPRLIEMFLVYGWTNAGMVRRVFDTILQTPVTLPPTSKGKGSAKAEVEGLEQYPLRNDVIQAARIFEKTVHSIQRKREKTSGGGGKGKGKGKGKAVVEDESGSGSDAATPDGRGSSPSNPADVVEVSYLAEAVRAFEALVRAGGARVSDLLYGRRTFVSSLLAAYDVASLLQQQFSLSVLSGGNKDFGSTTNPEWITILERLNESELGSRSTKVKIYILALIEAIITSSFLEPVGITSPPTDSLPSGANGHLPSPDGIPTISSSKRYEDLCDFLLTFLDHLHIHVVDGPSHFLLDSPLLVDFDVEHDLAAKLAALKSKIAGETAGSG